MKKFTIHQLTLVLFAMGIGFAFVGIPTFVGKYAATAFIYLSTTAILLRAIAECFRPSGEVLKSILWGFGVLIAYGFILPFWAKLHAEFGIPAIFNPVVHTIPVMLNIAVPAVKSLLSVTRSAS